MTDFGLPPKRALPPEVRERMRATLQEEMRQARRGGRWVFVAAAAVVLLVVGAVSVTTLIKPSPGPPAGNATPASGLDRCWAAVETAGKTASVPARVQWTLSYAEAQGDDSVFAVQAAGLPFFCETTLTSVTLSDPHAAPAYAPDGKTALLLYTASGLAAGITDRATYQDMDLYVGDLGATTSPVAATGQFSAFTGLDPAKTRLSSRGSESTTGGVKGRYVGEAGLLPPPAPPLLTLTDRRPEKKSAAGIALAECVAKAVEKLPDADSYAPGVLLQDGPYQVVLGKSGLNAVACASQPDPGLPERKIYRLYSNTFIGQSIPVRRLSVTPLGTDGGHIPFVGTVPDDTTKMAADVGLGNPVYADVAGGTFGMWLPAGAKPPAGDGMAWVKSENAAGIPSFNGWIPFK